MMLIIGTSKLKANVNVSLFLPEECIMVLSEYIRKFAF